jgi:hypothetical protein
MYVNLKGSNEKRKTPSSRKKEKKWEQVRLGGARGSG